MTKPRAQRKWPTCVRCGAAKVAYFRYSAPTCKTIETLCDLCAVEARLAGDRFGGETLEWEPVEFWQAPFHPWRSGRNGLVPNDYERDQWRMSQTTWKGYDE